ncbi:MAG: arginase [Thermodesulfobacteriota bacterium]|nr:arginase [Thermodesulfobacteriota bacterium]
MKKKISIIGVPMDFGQLHRGVDMGPAAARYTGLVSELRHLGYRVEDSGDVQVSVRDPGGDVRKKNYLKEIKYVCEQVYTAGRKAVQNDFLPVFLGGDHSIAMGTFGGISHDHPAGLIWIDAHADFNNFETSPSGNIHGMPVAALTGHAEDVLVDIGRKGPKVDPENIVMIGIRQLDKEERSQLLKSGITVYTMRDIDEQGISAVANKAMMKFIHMKRVHVSLDMDALDPVEAPGVGTPVPGGLTYREAHLLMEIISDSKKLVSMDLVEINPILDQANKTARLAVDLTVSALGKSII